jgi:hypothetical protein
MIIDRLGTTTLEGTTDQSWFQAAVDRRAEAAAVKRYGQRIAPHDHESDQPPRADFLNAEPR